MKQEGDRDITLDYDLFMKIKNMNRGSKGAGLLKPTVKSKKQNVKQRPGQYQRDRIDEYEAKKKKFGDTRKFIFRMEPREKTWEEKQDMAYKGRPVVSADGIEILQ